MAERDATSARTTGGCQCGAIRFAVSGPLGEGAICHCRMCQKAFGSLFAPLVGVAAGGFQVTRGEIATFRSSDVVERGYCRDCGTPLTFRYANSANIYLAIGALDEPEAAKPASQVGVEARLSWFADLAKLPEKRTDENDTAERLQKIAATNRQHPDHDTAEWPPAGQSR